MNKQLKLLLAAELEYCEREIKRYTDLGYPAKITKENALAYWRGRKDEVQEIRSKIEEGAT